MFTLEDKVAVVTGAASGFGKATAKRFAKADARVIMADIAANSEVAKEIGGTYVRTDVSKEEQVKALMETAVSTCGKLDIVVNNAGIIGQAVLVEGITEEDLMAAFDVNFKGVLWGIKHAVPLMSGGGSIMNTSSYSGLFGTHTYGIYITCKAAIIGITKTAALELSPEA